MIDQCLGNYLVLRNGEAQLDKRDYNALSQAHFAAKRGSSWTPWIGAADDVEFIACLWEVPNGVKACVTDRDFNSLELLEVSIETAASILRQAKQLQAVTK